MTRAEDKILDFGKVTVPEDVDWLDTRMVETVHIPDKIRVLEISLRLLKPPKSRKYTFYTMGGVSTPTGTVRLARAAAFLFLTTFSINASPALYELLIRGPLAQ